MALNISATIIGDINLRGARLLRIECGEMLNNVAMSYLEHRIRYINVVYRLLFLVINKCYYP